MEASFTVVLNAILGILSRYGEQSATENFREDHLKAFVTGSTSRAVKIEWLHVLSR